MVTTAFSWLVLHARSLTAIAAFCSATYGLWLAWAPLGYIVPAVFVLACLTWSHLKGVQ